MIPGSPQFLCFAILLVSWALVSARASVPTSANLSTGARSACQLLSEKFPNLIAFPGSSQFANDIAHWTLSSEQNATCSIEPGSAEDVSEILKIVGEDGIRAPFAVKGGGHAYNVGFSSTSGVQISMARFNTVAYDPASRTVIVGTGMTWDKVYEQLEPLGVSVAGGRVPGVGVAGLSLGGGYNWKTNQVGLTVDTILAHDIVLPSGEIVHVTNATQPDLFFALRGGLNNFGIVTAITYEAQPQTSVFAGSITYAQNVTDRVHNATATFDLTNINAKAQVIVTYTFAVGQFSTTAFLYYDGPTVPSGVFDVFTNIPSVAKDLKTRTYVDFLNASFGTGDLGIGPFRTAQHVIPILKYTVPVLEEMATSVVRTGTALTAQFPGAIIVVTCSAEPFLAPFAHSRGGAYPHPPTRQVTPASPFSSYAAASAPQGAGTYAAFVNATKQLSHSVQARGVAEGQSRWDDLLYPNYALADTPLELMYGGNVQRLNELADRFDPRGVMRQTGGFKFGL